MKTLAICLALVAATLALDLRPGFDKVDKDGNGKVSAAEFAGMKTGFDKNGDGVVNAAEFVANWMVNTGMSQEASLFIFFLMDANEDQSIDNAEHTATFHSMDDDSDGSISFPEFSHHMSMVGQSLVHLTTAKAALAARFDSADVSPKDGALSRAEAAAMFGQADTDGDGKVNKAEFVAHWQDGTSMSDVNAGWLFTQMDEDKDGYFGGQAERDNVYSAFDDNRDGKVELSEFLNTFLFLAARMDREMN